MIGGTVIEVADYPGRPDVLFVDCRDRTYAKDTCAVLVQRNERSERIQVGDSVWWQCGIVYWTPQENAVNSEEADRRNLRCHFDYDIQIPKVGYSGVKHPAREE